MLRESQSPEEMQAPLNRVQPLLHCSFHEHQGKCNNRSLVIGFIHPPQVIPKPYAFIYLENFLRIFSVQHFMVTMAFKCQNKFFIVLLNSLITFRFTSSLLRLIQAFSLSLFICMYNKIQILFVYFGFFCWVFFFLLFTFRFLVFDSLNIICS